MLLSFSGIRRTLREVGFRKDQKLSLKHVTFEIPGKYQNRSFKQAIGESTRVQKKFASCLKYYYRKIGKLSECCLGHRGCVSQTAQSMLYLGSQNSSSCGSAPFFCCICTHIFFLATSPFPSPLTTLDFSREVLQIFFKTSIFCPFQVSKESCGDGSKPRHFSKKWNMDFLGHSIIQHRNKLIQKQNRTKQNL